MNKLHNPLRILSLIALLTLPFGGTSQSNGFEVIRSLEQLDQIYEQLQKFYVDDVQPGTLSKIAIDAMLKELDPYTVYYHESNIEDYELMTTGQYGGIGALISRGEGEYSFVSEPYQDNPAVKAGIKAGDLILAIDGKSMKGKNTTEVSSSLKGPKGTKVEILVDRPTVGELTITVERDEIKLPDVPYSGMLNAEIGYVKLNGFTRTASTDVRAAVNALQSQGMKKLILDLRGNGGGLLIEAVRIVNMFIPRNEIVVTTQGRVAEENRTYRTEEEPLDLDIPLVVLMDEGSASASEIVAGSLQDLDRAAIIGTRSFGKGLVQRTYDLQYGAKIKLTIAKYYTPSGRCVQRLEYYDREDGEEVEEIPDSLVRIFKTRGGRDVIDGRGVEPDKAVEQEDLCRMAIRMIQENILFDFATDYYYAHPSIAAAADFEITDAEYEAFKAYVLSKEFSYSTASEEMLKKVHKTMDEEGFYQDAEAEYAALLEKVVPSKERDLEKFKNQIKSILENELVSRYYYQSGRAENSFRDDPFVKQAEAILQNISEYNTILGK